MRRFHLERDEDVSGYSGTGRVLEGVEFTDGTVAMRWLTGTPSTVIHENVEAVIHLHSHDGRTRLVWDD